MTKIPEVLFHERIPEDTLKLFQGQRQVIDELIRKAISGEPGPWINQAGGIEMVLKESLSVTLNEIEETQGIKYKEWEWGEFHQVRFNHPLSSVFPLQYLFNSKGGIPTGGSSVTVQAAAFTKDGTVNHGASWRFVIDVSDLTTGYHLVGPGQSGHVKSKWYDNQFEEWVEGQYHLTRLSVSEGEELTLIPQ